MSTLTAQDAIDRVRGILVEMEGEMAAEPPVEPDPEEPPVEPDPEPEPIPVPSDLADTVIGQLSATLVPGKFHPLESTLPEGFPTLGDLLRVPKYESGGGGRLSIADWTDSAHWDPLRKQAFFMGLRKNKRFIRYDAASNAWTIIPIEGDNAPPTYESYGHMYGRTALDWEKGHYYHLSADTLYRYWIDENRWEKFENTPLDDPISMDYHDEMDALVAVRGGGGGGTHYTAWMFQDDQWTELGKTTVQGYHASAQYNRKRAEYLAIGGTKSYRAVNLIDADGTIRVMGDAPWDITISNGVITYDPISGKYLLLRWGGVRTLYEYDADADTWREAINWQSGGWPFGSYGHMVPIPIDELGAILWITDTGSAQLYRHISALENAPPVEEPDEPEAPPIEPPPPASEARSKLYDIAADLAPGEFRPVETTFPPGIDDIVGMLSTTWFDPDQSGTYGLGWSGRQMFDSNTGRLVVILQRSNHPTSVVWLEPDLSWTGWVPGPDSPLYNAGGRRPYERLMQANGYVYFSPATPRIDDPNGPSGGRAVGRLIRAPFTDPTAWEETGVYANRHYAQEVGSYSSEWHPDIGKFVLYIQAGPYPEPNVLLWGEGDSEWVPAPSHPDHEGPVGRTRSSGYIGTTLYNPFHKEVLIYGGSSTYPSGADPQYESWMYTIDAQGRFQAHGPTGVDYRAGGKRLTYNPVTGDYLLLDYQALKLWQGDPVRGKPWTLLHDWTDVDSWRRPFGRYQNWHGVTPLPGTDVLIWRDQYRGVILHRMEEPDGQPA